MCWYGSPCMPRSVSIEAVPHMDLLLEVMPEGEVEERALAGHEFHGRRQPALNNRRVAGRQVQGEVAEVADDVDATVGGEGPWVDAWAGDDEQA